MTATLLSSFKQDALDLVNSTLDQECSVSKRISFGDLAIKLGYSESDKIKHRAAMSVLGCMLKLKALPKYDVCPTGGIGLIGSPNLSKDPIPTNFVESLQQFLETNCLSEASLSRTVVCESLQLNGDFKNFSLEKLSNWISEVFSAGKIVGFQLRRGSGISRLKK